MRNQSRQLRLFKRQDPCFGGALLRGNNPNHARPLSTKNPIHLVLKSEMAHGQRSMLARANNEKVWQIIRRQAKRARVRIYRYANGGNHLHLVVKIDDAELFKGFMRAVSGLIARHVLKAEKNSAQLKLNGKRFWIARPFTRIARWGRDYSRLAKYVTMNTFEAVGFISHQPRGNGSKRSRDSLEIVTVVI